MGNFIYNKSYNGWHQIYNICGIKIKKKKYEVKHFDTVNIVFDPINGLGNRILGLVNCINYYSPKTINMYWDKQGWVSASFNELFNANFDFEINEYSDFDVTKTWTNNKNERTIISPACYLITKNGKDLSLKYNEIQEEDKKEFLEIFSEISPSQKVLNRINDLNITEDYVGLQVRNYKDYELLGRNISLEYYFDEIENYSQNTKFYLCAMSDEIVSAFKEKFGERILILPNKNYSSMIDAVAELYILGRAKYAIYSPMSTFGELGYWLCGAKQNVRIAGKYNE